MARARRFFAVLVLGSLALAAGAVRAGPTDPVIWSRPPQGQGEAFVPPSTWLVANLPARYLEEEFFVEGRATLFNYAHNPPLGPTDLAPIRADVPWKTRLIVRRPEDPDDFNGTVVVEWWNSTAGFDTAPPWDNSAEYFARSGIVYVGVTNSTTSIGFLTGGCRAFGILPPLCGSRYATLSLPENGLAFEMMSQIASALRRGEDADNPLPAAYAVERLFHVGQSQQGGSVITYASGFHLEGVNDGYFIHSAINARPINFGPRCGDTGVPAFPDCTPRLAYPLSLVRTDLPVPVYQVVTQTDFETSRFGIAGRQPDTLYFRYFEVAGGAHSSLHENQQVLPPGLVGPDPVMLEDLCTNQMNTTADGPVFVSHLLSALWARLAGHATYGAFPNRGPHGVVMEQENGVLKRDERGNVLGGVRLPSLAAPTARYDSTNFAGPNVPPALIGLGNLACRLSGSVFPFDRATLFRLYGGHRSYVKQVKKSVQQLQRQGLMLPEDAAATIQAAERSSTGS